MSGPFDDEALREAYAPKLRDTSTGHGPRCPSPDALLAAAKGEGPERERLQVLDRALQCAACRRELALLQAVSGSGTGQRAASARSSSWRRFVPLAAAASIVLAVGIVSLDRWRQRPDEEIMRTGPGGAGEITLIAPASERHAAAKPVTFVWHSVPGAIQYTLEVDTNDGTVLFAARGADTVQTVPNLTAGERRWSVRAHMDDGSERRSVSRVLRMR